jgi:hypothetical protein
MFGVNTKRALVAAPGFILVASAGAQLSPKPLSASIGLNYLQAGSLGGATSHDGWLGAIGYHFTQPRSYAKSVDTSLEFWWAQHNGQGNKFSNYGLFAMGRTPFSNTNMHSSGFVPYYGAGIGIVRDEFIGQPPVVTSAARVLSSTSGSVSKWTMGEKLLVGAMLNQTWFVEGGYNWNGSIGGSSCDSWSVSVGVRF